jgi:hypothetical protein
MRDREVYRYRKVFFLILIAHLQSTQAYRVLSKWYGEAGVWREGGSIQ